MTQHKYRNKRSKRSKRSKKNIRSNKFKRSKKSISKKSIRSKHKSIVYGSNKSLKTICRNLLSNKISINMKEYKSGNNKLQIIILNSILDLNTVKKS